jgi:transcriptional regulator with GAF, ATPase, and Fis domain
VVIYQKGNLSIKKSWLSRDFVKPERQPVLTMSGGGDREIIGAALAETKGRVSGPAGAAAKLGIPPSTLESRIRSMRINKYLFKTGVAAEQ